LEIHEREKLQGAARSIWERRSFCVSVLIEVFLEVRVFVLEMKIAAVELGLLNSILTKANVLKVGYK